MNKQNLDELRTLINQDASKQELNDWLDRQYWLLYTIMPGSPEDQLHSVERQADNE